MERILRETQIPVDRFLFDSFGGRIPESYGDAFAELRDELAPFVPRKDRSHPYWSDAGPCSMLIDEVEAIWAAIDADDDWTPLDDKIAAIRRMGEALA
jgi:hypothetical protein